MIKKVDIHGFNFDYRVIRKPVILKDKTPFVYKGEQQYNYYIYEVWFGKYGEIVMYCASHEYPCADSLEDMKYEIVEYMLALTKPVIEWDTMVREARNARRRSKRRIKRDIADEQLNSLEKIDRSMQQIKDGTAALIPMEEVFAEWDKETEEEEK